MEVDEETGLPRVFNADIAVLDIAGYAQPWRKASTSAASRLVCSRVGPAGIGDCCGRAASGHPAAPPTSVMELATPHSITSSASATRFPGTSRPSALAVLRLMTSSNLVGCITGRSAGFSPLRMRPT